MSQAKQLHATVADLKALPPGTKAEIIHGALVPKASAGGMHGGVEASIAAPLVNAFKRKSGSDGLGGWWLKTETSVHYPAADCVFDHDIVGWKRERVPVDPLEFPVEDRPDWVCEVMLTTWKNDLEIKFGVLQRAGVPHYWVADAERKMLTVFELMNGFYTVAHVFEPAHRFQKIRPFEAIDLDVAVLFGADPEP